MKKIAFGMLIGMLITSNSSIDAMRRRYDNDQTSQAFWGDIEPKSKCKVPPKLRAGLGSVDLPSCSFVNIPVLKDALEKSVKLFSPQRKFRLNVMELLAEKEDCVDEIEALLQEPNININFIYPEFPQESLLHWACSRGNRRVVQFLLDQPTIKVNVRNGNGETPLHIAAKEGFIDIVRLLLESTEIRPDWTDRNGNTPLECASRSGSLDTVDILAAKTNITPTVACRILCSVCREGNLEMFERILQLPNFPSDSVHDFSAKILTAACAGGNYEMVDRILAFPELDMESIIESGGNILHAACARGNEKVVERLLKLDRIDVNSRNEYGRTPLHVACKNANLGVLDLLLNNEKTDVSLVDHLGYNVLHIACETGNCVVVQYILKNIFKTGKVDINARNIDRETPLHIAVDVGVPVVVLQLLQQPGIRTSIKNTLNETPLDVAKFYKDEKEIELLSEHIAKNGADEIEDDESDPIIPSPKFMEKASESSNRTSGNISEIKLSVIDKIILAISKNNVSELKRLIEENNIDVSNTIYFERSEFLSSLLHVACAVGQLDIVKFLLEQPGSNINIRDYVGNTPLHIVCQKGNNPELVRFLLEQPGIDVNAVNDGGYTPIFKMVHRHELMDVIPLLIQHPEFKPNIRDYNNNSALMVACFARNFKAIEALLNRLDVDVNQTILCGTDYETVLHMACRGGSLKVVNTILKRPDVDINKKEEINEETPLHTACSTGNVDIINALLKHEQIDVTAKDKNGFDALYYACLSGNPMAVDIIIKTGKFDINKMGSSLLMTACSNGNMEIIDFWLKRAEVDFDVLGKGNDNLLHLLMKGIIACDNDKYRAGYKPLASLDKNIEIIEHLIEKMSPESIKMKNADGETPLDIARNIKCSDKLIKILGKYAQR